MLGQTYQKSKSDYIRHIDYFESYFGAINFAIYAVISFVFYSFVEIYTFGADIQYADRILVYMFVSIELLNVMRMPMMFTITYAGHFKNTMRVLNNLCKPL